MLSSQKSHGLLSEDLIIQHNQTVHLQSHPICKQLKATDLFCILGHKQLESRQWNDGIFWTVKSLPLFSLSSLTKQAL